MNRPSFVNRFWESEATTFQDKSAVKMLPLFKAGHHYVIFSIVSLNMSPLYLNYRPVVLKLSFVRQACPVAHGRLFIIDNWSFLPALIRLMHLSKSEFSEENGSYWAQILGGGTLSHRGTLAYIIQVAQLWQRYRATRVLQFNSQNDKPCICKLPPEGIYG